MKKLIFASLVSLGLGACVKQGIGTKPHDMTVDQHLKAAETEDKIAAANRKRAADLHGGKGTSTYEFAADEHAEYAKQHRQAAASLSTANVPTK